MENVLELYHQPYDPARPVVCMDETSKQLVAETRVPIPAAPGRPRRVDYEYERCGTADVFIFTEPLGNWRCDEVTATRTRVDWAMQMKNLVDVWYPEATIIRVVMDNLNTHSLGSLYEAFPPEEARRIATKLELHYTPKHGELAERGRNRVARADGAVSQPSYPGRRHSPSTSTGVGNREKCLRRSRRLAIHVSRRAYPLETSLPTISKLTRH
jgi:hypothetical protein